MRVATSFFVLGAAACSGSSNAVVDGGRGTPSGDDASSSDAGPTDSSAGVKHDGGSATSPVQALDGSLLVTGDAGGCAVAPYTAPAPSDDASTSISSGSITANSTRSGSDFFDWTQLSGGSLATSRTPLCVTSHAGLGATITNPTGAVFKDVQGAPWAGNFAPMDNLLCSGQITKTGPITITFATPVSGVGAQMGSDIVSGTNVPFVEQMVLIGTSGQTLATFVANGAMDTAADNSAVYIGATDTAPEIKAVEFFISGAENALNNAYCMNRLSIQP